MSESPPKRMLSSDRVEVPATFIPGWRRWVCVGCGGSAGEFKRHTLTECLRTLRNKFRQSKGFHRRPAKRSYR